MRLNRRRISRKLLGYMPDKLRFEVMRNSVRINPNWPSPLFEIKIAETEYELENAYRLLHNSYVKSGFMNPDPTEMRVLPQHLLPQTTTIVAKWDGHVIGTLSLIRDNPFGLPMEKLFDLTSRRYNGRRLAEVSSLAVDPKHRGHLNQALLPLFRFVYQYARDYFGVHEFVIAVNPSMADLYLAFMCFERLQSKSRPYNFVKGAPAVGLYLNLETGAERSHKEFSHRPDSSNFHKYWAEIPKDPRNQIPKRQYHSAYDPILTPALLSDFFLDRAQLGQRLNFKEVQTLLEAYPFPEFQKVLQPLLLTHSRKNMRLETYMRAIAGPKKVSAEVLNVSRGGLLLRTHSGTLNVGDQIELEICLNENSSTKVSAEVRWCPKNSLYGLKIIEATDEWLRMVETLEREYSKHTRKLSIAA